MLTKTKSFSLKAVTGADITPEMMEKINKYAIEPLTEEQVYVRKYIMAHNGIDRDRERFPEALLDDFADTLPGKSFLIGHQRPAPGIGLYFDASTEEITPEKFLQLTGEEIKLPENIKSAKILWGYIYLVKAGFNEKEITNIEAGVYRHASIGFKSSGLNPIKGEFDQVLYYEYVPPGEALEGSIVWLGAQPGATSQKHLKDSDISISPGDTDWEQEGGNPLIPSCNKNYDGDSKWERSATNPLIPKEGISGSQLKGDERQDKSDDIDSKYDPKWEEDVNNPLIFSKKNHKEKLVDDYILLKTEAGDTSPDKQEYEREITRACPVSFLESEIKALKSRQNPLIPIDSK